MKKQIILTITAVIFVAGSILAFANNSLEELTKNKQCSSECCSQCPPDCCNGGGSSCCKK